MTRSFEPRNDRQLHFYADSVEHVGTLISPAPRVPRVSAQRHRQQLQPQRDESGWLIAGLLAIVMCAGWAVIARWWWIMQWLREMVR